MIVYTKKIYGFLLRWFFSTNHKVRTLLSTILNKVSIVLSTKRNLVGIFIGFLFILCCLLLEAILGIHLDVETLIRDNTSLIIENEKLNEEIDKIRVEAKTEELKAIDLKKKCSWGMVIYLYGFAAPMVIFIYKCLFVE